ncbi:MAG: UDP-N-acetylmuramoyl-tripeptide--D-alanyl-D-alanine ligase [Candidatus Nanopelagicales bacterium]|jgi:UDP-N-acetylmuramoyl-tripeptide--D-alanyl-D-alanine ligase|nr:UDP-N-acetylmuramoyl-tripeptide--D-alanyl-D-alanine ligase [Candidatus Nanopelagicales bacterium]
MIQIDIAGVAAAVGGTLVDCPDPTLTVTGAVADSRAAAAGDLYVAIAGERVDGHDFAAAAHAAGAVVTLGTRPTGQPTIVVADDPVAALGRLASHALAQLPGTRVVALTGSSGKTTTKDLIATLLEDLGPTVAPAGSFNTEVGLPLTVLRATADTRFLVLEMGARGIGHVATLCRIAPPDVSVVLNVGSAHLGEFGSREAIGRAKGEIVEALGADGLAVLNADDPIVAAMATRCAAPVVTFGSSPAAQVRAVGLTLDGSARAQFTLHTPAGDAAVQLAMAGEHMAANACAAAAVALHFGMPPARIAELLGSAQPRSRWRMEVSTTASGITVVNDAYNANPESMRAALRSLAAMRGQGRTIAVLGEMRELGADSIAAHDEIGRLAVRLDISKTIAVGQGARALYLGAAQEGSWNEEAVFVADVDSAIALLRGLVRPGDVVLVKASRSIGLETVAHALLEDLS